MSDFEFDRDQNHDSLSNDIKTDVLKFKKIQNFAVIVISTLVYFGICYRTRHVTSVYVSLTSKASFLVSYCFRTWDN